MEGSSQLRTYVRSEAVVFRMTNASFGGLSNMAPGFPLCINGVRIHTTEALYQACRFPHLPHIQEMIIDQPSPMTAKMRSKPYRGDSRKDWDRVRVRIMRWCLRVKLVQNPTKFTQLLRSTDNRPIVEESRKDSFWGAKPAEDGTLVGMNVLGRLLMELREEIKNCDEIVSVEPLAIADFLLLGKPISEVHEGALWATDKVVLHKTDFDKQIQQQLALISGDSKRGAGKELGPSINPALQHYSEYKVSDAEWLGTLPSHWRQLRAKFLFREVDDHSVTGQEELLSVSHLTGVTPRSQKTVTMFLAKSNVGHKVCRRDDVVINTMWAWMGALGVTQYAGIVSPSYGVYRPISAGEMLPRYADYLLRTPYYVAEYQRRSTGVNSSRLRLYPEHFLRIPLIIPPLEEQEAIVRFLDQANVRFNRLLRSKKRALALVTEMLLNVTERALKSNDTRTLRLSTAAEIVLRPIDRQAQRTYTPIGLYNRGRGIFHKRPVTGSELGDSEFYRIEDGDLVLSGQFAWEGAVALAKAKDSGCVASHRYPILRGRAEYATSAMILALLRTSYGAVLLDHHSRGAAGRNRPLNIRTLLKEKVPIPPLRKQVQIAELLDKEYSVAQALLRAHRLVQEHEARLAADVATGKLDVRAAAQHLPDEIEKVDRNAGDNSGKGLEFDLVVDELDDE